jgi:hypothetical protein
MQTIALPIGKLHPSGVDMRLIASSTWSPYVVVHSETILKHTWLSFSLLERSPTLGQAGLEIIKTTTASWLYIVPNKLGSKPRVCNFRPRATWREANPTEIVRFSIRNMALRIPKSELSGRSWFAFDVVLQDCDLFTTVKIASDDHDRFVIELTKFYHISEYKSTPSAVFEGNEADDLVEAGRLFHRLEKLPVIFSKAERLPDSSYFFSVRFIDKYLPYEPVRMIHVSVDPEYDEAAPNKAFEGSLSRLDIVQSAWRR